jgi:hypothetical protein
VWAPVFDEANVIAWSQVCRTRALELEVTQINLRVGILPYQC